MTCVVWRVDIDHPYLVKTGLLQELQDFQIVAFDKQIVRLVEIDRILSHRLKRRDARRLAAAVSMDIPSSVIVAIMM